MTDDYLITANAFESALDDHKFRYDLATGAAIVCGGLRIRYTESLDDEKLALCVDYGGRPEDVDKTIILPVRRCDLLQAARELLRLLSPPTVEDEILIELRRLRKVVEKDHADQDREEAV